MLGNHVLCRIFSAPSLSCQKRWSWNPPLPALGCTLPCASCQLAFTFLAVIFAFCHCALWTPQWANSLSDLAQGKVWRHMAGNGTGLFHISELSHPLSLPMKPTPIPWACSLVGTVQGWGQAFISSPCPWVFLSRWASALCNLFCNWRTAFEHSQH